jgi:DNA-binding transcriptional LysR family regulator
VDLDDLRAFALVSDLGSLGAAARALGESKATVSRRITRLEGRLHAALLQRSPRGIAPTENGVAYRARVAEILALLDDANSAATHGGRPTPSGVLRVTLAPGFSTALAPDLAAFCRQFPDVSLVVHVASRFVELEKEGFDVALRSSAQLADSSLKAVRVGNPHLEGILVAAPSYLAEHGAPSGPHDLVDHRILAVSDTGGPYTMSLHGADTRTDITLPLAIAGSDVELVRELTLHGSGIAMLPRASVRRELEEGRLVHVLHGHVWPSQNLFLIYRAVPYTPLKVRAFVDFLRQRLAAPRRVAGTVTHVAKTKIPRPRPRT